MFELSGAIVSMWASLEIARLNFWRGYLLFMIGGFLVSVFAFHQGLLFLLMQQAVYQPINLYFVVKAEKEQGIDFRFAWLGVLAVLIIAYALMFFYIGGGEIKAGFFDFLLFAGSITGSIAVFYEKTRVFAFVLFVLAGAGYLLMSVMNGYLFYGIQSLWFLGTSLYGLFKSMGFEFASRRDVEPEIQ